MICFRVDSSNSIGSGHVMRCLTLAHELNRKKIPVAFICCEHPGNLISHIKKKFRVLSILARPTEMVADGAPKKIDWKWDAKKTVELLHQLTEPTDWLIVDHYQLDFKWEIHLRPHVKKMFVIDDLANRKHDCDLLLDQNYYLEQSRYVNLVQKNTRQLIGLDYLLLRREFEDARRNLLRKKGAIEKILVFFGGFDISNETCKTLAAIKGLENRELFINVVIGATNKHCKTVQELIFTIPNAKLHIQIDNMAELMVLSDLFIGTGGGVTWERCFLELPSIVITMAENQVQAAKDLEKMGVIYYLGKSTHVARDAIIKAIQLFLDNPHMADIMSKKCRNLVDGLGTNKVVNALMN